ncbi:MAG: DNA polymerase III subunit gamma/tau [Pirellulales bacterium]
MSSEPQSIERQSLERQTLEPLSSESPSVAAATGEYVVVARRYRPQSFEDLVGQGQVSQALSNAINTHRVGHAYLFTGARGVGKTSTARIFAKALNCVHGPTPRPCNECDICQGVAQGGDVDVIEIDGASNRGIDEIRQLRANVSVRPSRARFKIYIIDEVHMLTTPAFNALLKTLEEPPEHVKFIFCTTDPEKIPITVLSRCQRFDFPPVEAESIIGRLEHIVSSEGREADDEAIRLLARRAAGSMRDSQSLLEQLLSFTTGRITVDEVHKMLGTAGGGRLAKLVKHLVARDAAGALEELERSTHESVEIGQLAEQLLGYLRDLMAVAVGCKPDLLLHASTGDYAELKQLGEQWGLETALAAVQVLDAAVTKMRHSVHARVLLEVALVRICKLEALDDLARLIAAMQAAPVGQASSLSPTLTPTPSPTPAPPHTPSPAPVPP